MDVTLTYQVIDEGRECGEPHTHTRLTSSRLVWPGCGRTTCSWMVRQNLPPAGPQLPFVVLFFGCFPLLERESIGSWITCRSDRGYLYAIVTWYFLWLLIFFGSRMLRCCFDNVLNAKHLVWVQILLWKWQDIHNHTERKEGLGYTGSKLPTTDMRSNLSFPGGKLRKDGFRLCFSNSWVITMTRKGNRRIENIIKIEIWAV
jgi:hypothetical protein